MKKLSHRAERIEMVKTCRAMNASGINQGTAGNLSLRVKELLSAMLVESEPTFDQVATAFGTSRRTLRRRLALEGTSVTALRNEIKAEFARQLLVNSTMSIIDIGATLHYTKPGAFSRAYKGWTGASPQEARRNAGRH